MQIERLSAHIGAAIHGVDPRDMDDATFADVHRTLLEHEVVFFRDTPLEDADHLAIAARFGQPSLFPMQRLLGDAEPRITAIVDGPNSPPGADDWHTDVTWTAEPPKIALLRAIEIPEVGGDTLWASMTSAYDLLSPTLRGFFETLSVVHDHEHFLNAVLGKMPAEAAEQLRLVERMQEQFPAVEHPLIRTHPETGRRAVFFGGRFMKRIVGLEPFESERLLAFLDVHVQRPHLQVRWHWRAGDFAIWDERSTIHRALGDHYPARREVRRITVDGDRPSFERRRAA